MANDEFDNAQTDKEMLERFKEEIEPIIDYSEKPIDKNVDKELKSLLDQMHILCLNNNVPFLAVYDSGIGPVFSYYCPAGISKLYPDLVPILNKYF